MMSEEDNNIQANPNNGKEDNNNRDRDTDAFLSKLSVLTNDNRERIEEQLSKSVGLQTN